eukprot:358844-Chlamydomonas_euryale.AAC.3
MATATFRAHVLKHGQNGIKVSKVSQPNYHQVIISRVDQRLVPCKVTCPPRSVQSDVPTAY